VNVILTMKTSPDMSMDMDALRAVSQLLVLNVIPANTDSTCLTKFVFAKLSL